MCGIGGNTVGRKLNQRTFEAGKGSGVNLNHYVTHSVAAACPGPVHMSKSSKFTWKELFSGTLYIEMIQLKGNAAHMKSCFYCGFKRIISRSIIGNTQKETRRSNSEDSD